MSKTSIAAIIISLILIPISVVLSQTPELKPLGSFTELSGGVKYDKGGDAGYCDISKEEALKLSLYSKDKISTSDATTGEIMMSCGVRLEIARNSELQIGYYNVRIGEGGVWINYKPVKDEKGKVKLRVETPVGVIGIRGTKFAVLVSPDRKKVMVQVREGVVSFDSPGGSAIVNGGELLTAEDGRKIEKPVKIDPAGDILKAGMSQGMDNVTKTPVEEAVEKRDGDNDGSGSLDVPKKNRWERPPAALDAVEGRN